jgi:hypothetical protein
MITLTIKNNAEFMSHRIISFSELNAILAHPFNDPKSDIGYSEKIFLEESRKVHDALREKLELLGDFDKDETDDDCADFWMQGGGITRCISVTLTSRAMWNDNLIPLIQSFLKSTSKDYLVYIDSSFELDQPFFILVTKDSVLGYAENPQWLRPFGFNP